MAYSWVLLLLLSAPQDVALPYTPMTASVPLPFTDEEQCKAAGQAALGRTWTLIDERETGRGIWGFICVRR